LSLLSVVVSASPISRTATIACNWRVVYCGSSAGGGSSG